PGGTRTSSPQVSSPARRKRPGMPRSGGAGEGESSRSNARMQCHLSGFPDFPSMLGLFKKNDHEERPWFARLKDGLANTRSHLSGIFGGGKIDEALFEQ